MSLLWDTIISLRRQRNDLLVLYRLPTEVLSNIFHFSGSIHSAELVTITHVSHFWRSVAVGDPTLWMRVDLSCPLRVTASIQRSKGLPLHVQYRGSRRTDLWEASFEEALALLRDSRTSLLDIGGLAHEVNAILLATAPSSSHVRKLSARVIGNRREPVCIFSDDVCDKAYPHIEALTLDNCTIPWTSTLFLGLHSLRELCIKYPAFTESRVPGTRDLLVALGTMCLLEHLELHRVLVHQDTLDPYTVRAHLPRLTTLKLHDNSDSALHFLSALTVPPMCRIGVICQCFAGDPQDEAVPLLKLLLKQNAEWYPDTLQFVLRYDQLDVMAFYDRSSTACYEIAFCDDAERIDVAGWPAAYFNALAPQCLHLASSIVVVDNLHGVEGITWAEAMAGVRADTFRITPGSITGFQIFLASMEQSTLAHIKELIIDRATFVEYPPYKLEELRARMLADTLHMVCLRNCYGLVPSILDGWEAMLPHLQVIYD